MLPTTICSVLYHINLIKSKIVYTIFCCRVQNKSKTAQNPLQEIVQFYGVKENESIKKKAIFSNGAQTHPLNFVEFQQNLANLAEFFDPLIYFFEGHLHSIL